MEAHTHVLTSEVWKKNYYFLKAFLTLTQDD